MIVSLYDKPLLDLLRIIAQLFALVKRFLYHLYVRQLSPSYVAAHYSKGFKISQALFNYAVIPYLYRRAARIVKKCKEILQIRGGLRD